MQITPVIVGSSGWISSAAQKYFWNSNSGFGPPIVLGSRKRACNIYGNNILPLGEAVQLLSSLRPRNLAVFHFAYLTQEQVVGDAGSYLERIDAINQAVIAILEQLPVSSLVYASSGAAGFDFSRASVASSSKFIYGKKKFKDEILFHKICCARKIKYLAPRIFGLGGNYINKLDGYALSNMILQALNSGEITVRSKFPVWRSYVNVNDLIELLAKRVARDDGSKIVSERFDATLGITAEMGDLATSICRSLGIGQEKIHRIGYNVNAEPDCYIGNSDQFISMAQQLDHEWSDLDDIVDQTIVYIKTILRQGAGLVGR